MNTDEFLSEVISNTPKLNGVDTDTLLRDVYESSYQIYNHLGSSNNAKGKKRPLASVALHDSEDITETSLLFNSFETFAQKGIKETFNLNLLEYLSLPTEYCTKLTEIATKEAIKKTGIINDLEKTMNKQ